eukprot:179246_1
MIMLLSEQASEGVTDVSGSGGGGLTGLASSLLRLVRDLSDKSRGKPGGVGGGVDDAVREAHLLLLLEPHGQLATLVERHVLLLGDTAADVLEVEGAGAEVVVAADDLAV